MRDWCSAIGTKDDLSGTVRRTSILKVVDSCLEELET